MMKKKVIIVILIVVILHLFTNWVAHLPYRFRQEFDQIVKIEILKKEQDIYGYVPEIMEVLKTLDVVEHRTFIDGLMKVDGSRVGMDPPSGFGAYIIRITYQDGEIELISDYNNGYISVDGIVHTDNYCMNKRQFYDFLSGVLGEQVTGLIFG